MKNVDISVDLMMMTESACKPEKLCFSAQSILSVFCESDAAKLDEWKHGMGKGIRLLSVIVRVYVDFCVQIC